MLQSSIKNLIFDLGGVIIGLNPSLTIQALAKLGNMEEAKAGEVYLSHQAFKLYETGLISCQEFREELKTLLNTTVDEDIDKAWNMMLLEIPMRKLQFLKELKEKYRLFLLSNTNHIHLTSVNNILKKVSGDADFSYYFDKVYYSHLMQKRKPDAEIFEQVLVENNLVPEETLFIDDTMENIQGAAALGIQTLHVTSDSILFDFFSIQ